MISEIKNLLNNYVGFDKPKKIKIGGEYTKKFLKWNRKMIKQGKTEIYLDPNKFYDKTTKGYKNVKKIYDMRYKKKVIKQKYRNEYIYFDGVLRKKKETLDFRYVFNNDNTGWNEENQLWNNNLLRLIIRNNNINGDYRLIIKSNEKGKLIDRAYYIDSNFWKNHQTDFIADSEFMIWNNPENIDNGDIIYFIFTKEKKLRFNYYQQKFLKGVNHCFFQPINDYFKEMVLNSKSKSTQEKYKCKMRIILGKTLKTGEKKIGLMEHFKEGIPEKLIGSVCEKLQIGVDIEQPFNTNKLFEYRSNKKPIKVFRFLNTRLDHLEKNEKSCNIDNIYKGFDPVKVNKKRLLEIEEELTKNGELCISNKNMYGITSIRTLNNFYILEDDFNEVKNNFELETGLYWCSIDALKYPKLQNFIDNSIHYNGTIDLKILFYIEKMRIYLKILNILI